VDRAASTPFDRVMSASTALVVSAIAGVVLGMAFVKMPQPMTADFQGQQAPARTTTAGPDPVVPVPVTVTSVNRPPRTTSSTTTTTPTSTTTTTTAPITTTGRPTKTTKPKPPRPTTTVPSSTTTTTDDGGILGPVLG
jgi:hypothetical protein